MSTAAALPSRAEEASSAALPLADSAPPAGPTLALVRRQVRDLLQASPSYHELPAAERRDLAHGLVRIASYAAECLRDVCEQSQRLGEVPVVRRAVAAAGLARAQEAGEFQPRAAGQIARITEQTLHAIAFPTFVADLIRGTFNAIVQTSIQQMEAFVQLIGNVGKTVDEFMADNISDHQARDWLAQRYPEHIHVQGGRAVPREEAGDREPPAFQRDLKLSEGVALDDSSVEETLVPAARRALAESRLQILSTLVLMGVQRIVVTGGKIRATMGFHIDTSDRAREELATDLDTRAAASGSFGFGPWSAAASMSFSYVRSTRASSDAELNVEADLTGEVEIHFKSDYFPLERFANQGAIGRIQGNTAVPEANTPPPAPSGPFSTPPAVGGEVPRFTSPRTRRSPRPASSLPPIGTPPGPARLPAAPVPPGQLHTPAAPQTPASPAPQTAPRTETPATGGPAPSGGEGAGGDGSSEAGQEEPR